MSAPNSQDLFSQDAENPTQESELRSGLRSSDMYSQLSYSELSSLDPTSIHGGVGGTQTDLRSTDLTEIPRNVIYGTNVNIANVMQKFKLFLQQFKLERLEDETFISDLIFDPEIPYYLQKLRDMSMINQTHLDIDCSHLKSFSEEVFKNLISFPKEVIPAMDTVARTVYVSLGLEGLGAKLETRPFNCDSEVRDLRSLTIDNGDEIVTVSGLVYRLTSIIPEVVECTFQCNNCWQTVNIPSEGQSVTHPEACNQCHARFSMQMKHNLNQYIDKQIVKVQECPDEMPAGETPQTVTMFAYQGLVDTVQPGDRVIVTGIFRYNTQRENFKRRNVLTVLNNYIDVLHIKKTSSGLNVSEKVKFTEDRLQQIKDLSQKPDVYERLASGIASSVYEHDDIKKGLLLQLFGGNNSDNVRGNIHVLLCGDPGTSKSQLLQYIHNISPRSQYSSGKGISGAGLTAYITHDPETKHAVLQAGSLVLADNGVCCIDEFDKMAESTRSVLHEVMEQQTLSIAKAGVICQMNARTSVLAASNPVLSKWDSNKTIVENIKLPPSLLSRFDLIFLMLNPQTEANDTRLGKYLSELYVNNQQNESEADKENKHLSLDIIKDYISYARATIEPKLTKEAFDYLRDEYVSMRKVIASSRGRHVAAYPRQLESLRRLSEAHARMRLSKTVTLQDCQEARRLQREALKQSAVDPVTGLIDVSILATGISGDIRRKREELATAVEQYANSKGIKTIQFQLLLDGVRGNSDRMISRELFEEALNVLKVDSKIEAVGKVIRFK